MINVVGVLLGILVMFLIFYNFNFQEKSFLLSIEETISLKGISIIIIIIGHYCRYTNQSGLFTLFGKVGYLGAAVFFFLSGYGIVKSFNKNAFRNYFRDKMHKVYFPFIIVNIVTIIVYMLLMQKKYTVIQILNYIVGFKLIDSILWYVCVIIVFYILFYILFKYLNKSLAQMMLLAFSIVYCLICIINKVDSQWYTTSLCLFLGVAVSFNEERVLKYINTYKIVLLLNVGLFITSVALNFIFDNNQLIKNISCYFSSIFFILILISILKTVYLSNKISLLIGNISYIVYLIHMKIFNIAFVNAHYYDVFSFVFVTLMISLCIFYIQKFNFKMFICRLSDKKTTI